MANFVTDKGCIGCMKSSPVGSMIGMIIVLFGIGSFGGGFIITWKMIDIKEKENIFPPMEYVIYGIVSSVIVYVVLSYVLAALSSGYNRKRFFEGSNKAKIGRCFTIFNIMWLMINSLIWIFVSCAMSFFFLIIMITDIRLKSKSQSNMPIDLSYYGFLNLTYDSKNFVFYETSISISFAFGGALVVVVGFMQMLCCAAMNYVRLSEERYYDNSSYIQDKSEQILSAF